MRDRDGSSTVTILESPNAVRTFGSKSPSSTTPVMPMLTACRACSTASGPGRKTPSVAIPRSAARLANAAAQSGRSTSRQLIGVWATNSRLFGSPECHRAGTQSGAAAINRNAISMLQAYRVYHEIRNVCNGCRSGTISHPFRHSPLVHLVLRSGGNFRDGRRTLGHFLASLHRARYFLDAGAYCHLHVRGAGRIILRLSDSRDHVRASRRFERRFGEDLGIPRTAG